jgi:hypothetical protein
MIKIRIERGEIIKERYQCRLEERALVSRVSFFFWSLVLVGGEIGAGL